MSDPLSHHKLSHGPPKEEDAKSPLLITFASTGTYTVYRQRYLVLLLLSLSSALSAFQWIYIAPIQVIASDVFNASALQINTISVLFFALYLPASILGGFLMEGYGLRNTLLIGAIINCLCAGLKASSTYIADSLQNPDIGYICLFFGQVLGAIAQPLITNPPPRLSADWFPDKERDLATVLATQANIVGQLAGSLIPPLVVNTSNDLGKLGLIQTGLTILVIIGTYLGLKDRPATPPSSAAAIQWLQYEEQERMHKVSNEDGTSVSKFYRAYQSLEILWAHTKLLLKDKNFNYLNISFSVATSVGWILLTVETQLLTPCGYSDDVAGASGAALLGLGIFTSILAAPFMSKFRAFCLMQKITMGVCLLATIMVLALCVPNKTVLVIISWLILGSGLQPLVPLTLEHAAEITYPVPADVSSAVLQTGANVFATVQTYIVTALLNVGGSVDCSSVITPTAGVILGCMIFAFFITLLIKPVYKRTEAQQK